MFSVTQRSFRFFTLTLFMAMLALTGCQTAPQKGLTAAQIAVLKQQGFELTDEGWAFGLSGKVLFGSDVESLNAQSTEIVERIGKALLGLASTTCESTATPMPPAKKPTTSNCPCAAPRACATY